MEIKNNGFVFSNSGGIGLVIRSGASMPMGLRTHMFLSPTETTMGNLPPHQNSSLSPDTQWRGRLNCDGNLIRWMVSFQYLDFLSKIKWILQRIYICSRPTCLEDAPPYLPHRWHSFEKREMVLEQGKFPCTWDKVCFCPSLPYQKDGRGTDVNAFPAF